MTTQCQLVSNSPSNINRRGIKAPFWFLAILSAPPLGNGIIRTLKPHILLLHYPTLSTLTRHTLLPSSPVHHHVRDYAKCGGVLLCRCSLYGRLRRPEYSQVSGHHLPRVGVSCPTSHAWVTCKSVPASCLPLIITSQVRKCAHIGRGYTLTVKCM